VPPNGGESNHLPHSVDAGVSPTGANNPNPPLGHTLNCSFQLSLNGTTLCLHLKAQEIKTIILNRCPASLLHSV
jgi:hypothetical protein